MTTSRILPAPKIAALSIHFLVIGGGIAGLSCAVALARVGHTVTVLERQMDLHEGSCGSRVAPNLSKILYHWGLEEDVRKIAVKSGGIELGISSTGESLGVHHWDDEMLREARGEFLFMNYGDIRQLLHDAAISLGVKIRLGTEVTSIDPDKRRAKLANGEVVMGDVIVGADGVNGVTRQLVLEQEAVEEEPPTQRYNVYTTRIPRNIVEQDPELAPLFDEEFKRLFVSYGSGGCVIAFPVGPDMQELAFEVYTGNDGNAREWGEEASAKGLAAACAGLSPRMQKLAKLSPQAPQCVAVLEYAELEDWVHDSGRLLLVGDAAHPMPAGCIHDDAMALEDGAVLAKLFSHIRTEDQIPNLLYAFQDLRQPHVKTVLAQEIRDIDFMSLPDCEMQQGRDDSLRTKRDAGIDVMAPSSTEEEMPQWAEVKFVFCYDAEDDADNWWMEWGLLRERARGTDVALGFVEPVAIRQGRMSFSEPITV